MVGAVATTPNSAGPARAWHPEHARCLGWGPEDKPNACKTPGAPHKAGGRCRHCAGAQQRYDEDQRILQHQRESSPEPAPVKRWSRNHDACVGWDDRNGLRHPCSTAHAPHASHGRCINCAQKQVREAEIAAAATPAPQPAADLAVAARATVGIAQPAAPAFEVFTQVGPIKENGPALTVRLDGSVTINAAAYELLGRPAFVELLYAREGRMLGLRASPSVPHARTIRRDKDKKRIFVSARPLLKFYALEQARAVPASTRQYGDVLAVQLTTDRARG